MWWEKIKSILIDYAEITGCVIGGLHFVGFIMGFDKIFSSKEKTKEAKQLIWKEVAYQVWRFQNTALRWILSFTTLSILFQLFFK